MKHVAIIGNGIAGITAARYIRKLSDYKITVISAESEYFWSRTALMYIYMGHMKFHHTKPYEDWFWKKNRINLVHDFVKEVDPNEKKLHLKKEGPLSYDILIIASGSTPKRGGWTGEDLKGVTPMVSLQDLERIEEYTKEIKSGVVIGGGLIGIELAEMLLSRNIEVTFLVREKSFWNAVLPPEESEMVNRHIRRHHIHLKLQTEATEMIADEQGRVKGVKTQSGEVIPCQFAGITIGVNPQITFLAGSGIETDRGILVDRQLKTNISDVYAIGDCAQHKTPPAGRNVVEQIWYTGRIMGETVARIICGENIFYQPGIFYNSAKFLDIEYQTYGYVPVKSDESHDSFYWENEAGDKSLRIVFDKNELTVSGFNLMGIRYRQYVCEQWINTGTSLKKVMENLEAANFNPEFHQKNEPLIREKFNASYPHLAITERRRKKLLNLF